MGVTFDIIGSILVRTAIVLIVLRMNVSLNTMVNETVAHSTIQQNLSILRDVMSADFEYAGLGAPTGTAFLTAAPDKIMFRGDIDGDGILETVYYYYGDISELSNTQNPNDRKLYRQIDGGSILNIANGVTKCVFTYYNGSGIQTTDVTQIKMFSIVVKMQDGTPINEQYPTSFWEQSFFPLNL